jgi:hypothetical protein
MVTDFTVFLKTKMSLPSEKEVIEDNREIIANISN